jgi:hypothetical protein
VSRRRTRRAASATPAQILIDVARELSKYEDGGNKVALVQDILGKGAERYLPLLKDMAEGTDLVGDAHGEAGRRGRARGEERAAPRVSPSPTRGASS